MHSQRVNENCTNSWIIAEQDGCVVCAHCDCVAGLGETCTHICAILFYIDGSLRRCTETSVTDSKSTWVIPSKVAAPDKVAEIEFTAPSKKCWDDMPVYNKNFEHKNRVPPLSSSEIGKLLSKLQLQSSGLHAVVKPFSLEIHEQLQSKGKYMFNTFCRPEYEMESLQNLQRIGKLAS